MKKIIKFITLFLFAFIFLFKLINASEAFAIDINKKKEITKIFNYDIFIKGRVIPINDIESLNQEIEARKQMLSFVAGYNENYDEALLTVESFDFSEIDISKVGTYTIIIKLQIDSDYSEEYFISDELRTLYIPIRISDPNYLDIFVLGVNASTYDIDFLKPVTEDLDLLCFQSDIPMTIQELENVTWDLYDTMPPIKFFRISRNELELNKHYYFRIKHDTEYSNIIHIFDDGNISVYDSIGGDRDGGDSEGDDVPDIIQPPPINLGSSINSSDDGDESNSESYKPTLKDPSDNESDKRVYLSDKKLPTMSNVPNVDNTLNREDGVFEYFGENKDIISGYRLKLMYESSGGKAIFSKNGVTVILLQSLLETLNIKDNDSFCIEIKNISSSEFSLFIAVNGVEVKNIENITFMVPYTKNFTEGSLSILCDSSNIISLYDYDMNQKVLSFTANSTGTFNIRENVDRLDAQESNIESKPPNKSIFIGCIVTIIILSISAILFIAYRYTRR
ncbi:hypothetical protein SAMN02745196_01017 [Clostridium collagenovorans DSM 3089]|uniref:Uncharacterized protein n=1 Tax=Clostridium collagenovorans DSM 3089 TaxID=1121306 RepID=A0A1M5UZJ0_9CLOT|nr:hypothetical protein [Clostridium collagenovorans]SHH68389.1 hypothetical protein SAMN02745196_01017 [Clostridium collagenovorans DSM 3089]